MSARLCAKIWALNLDPTEKYVLLALGDYGDDSGENIYPGYDTLAKKTGLSERTIVSKIQALTQAGLVTRKSVTSGRGNRQEFVINLKVAAPRKDAPFSPFKPSERVKMTALKGENNGRERVKMTALKGENNGSAYMKNHHETLREPLGTETAASAGRFLMSPSDAFDNPPKVQDTPTAKARRFILMACRLWEEREHLNKWMQQDVARILPAVERDLARLRTPKYFLEFWDEYLGRKGNPKPDAILEQKTAYLEWLKENK